MKDIASGRRDKPVAQEDTGKDKGQGGHKEQAGNNRAVRMPGNPLAEDMPEDKEADIAAGMEAPADITLPDMEAVVERRPVQAQALLS